MEADGLKKSYEASGKKCNIPPDSNILGGRFVNTLKNYNSPSEMPKARFGTQDHNDRDQAHIVHDSFTTRPSSNRVILSIEAILEFWLFPHDVTQACA